MTNLEEEYSGLKKVDLDLLVLGAGGSGLRAAIAAAEANPDLNIGIVTKTLLGKAHTVMAEGGAAAAFGNVDDRDSWKVHFRDTFKGSYYKARWELNKILAEEAPEQILQLEHWGAMWDRTEDGKILQRNFGGHAHPRLVHIGDRTGLEIIRTLQDKAVHCGNITPYVETTITKLLAKDGEIMGAFGYNRTTGKLILFRTKGIILASGGMGKLFDITSNSWECVGSGQALAFDIGAKLIDMEFVQFHPTGMAYPKNVAGTLVTEAVRGDGGILKNSEGKRFMFNYIPERFKKDYADTEKEAEDWVFMRDPDARKPPELLTRNVVSAAIISEVKAGRGSKHGAVFLDIAATRDAATIEKKLPSMVHQMKMLAGLDITKEPFEVAPTAHYAMGGMKFEPETSMSNIKGLFGAGEVIGGVHGGNRLGGNALADLIVFGNRAGKFAAEYVNGKSLKDIPESMVKSSIEYTLSPFNREGEGENPFQLHEELRKFMSLKYGESSKESLESALDDLKALKERVMKVTVKGDRNYNTAWHQALDLMDLITIGEITVISSLERKESRGGHVRSDYPDQNINLQDITYIVTKGKNGEVQISEEYLTEPPEELLQVMKDLGDNYEFQKRT